jgi:hypothetical protein
MCPACIAGAAAMVAGAGSSGGILAVCISKFRGNKMATSVPPLKWARLKAGRSDDLGATRR